MLYTLNLHNVTCQLYLKEKKKIELENLIYNYVKKQTN